MEGADWAALVVGVASLGVSAAALIIAVFAIKASDRNSSASTLVTLNDGFRQGWARFRDTEDEQQRYCELSELLNHFEIACAIYVQQSIHGTAREILGEYLCHTLAILVDDEEAKQWARAMVGADAESTFKYISKFEDLMRKSRRAPDEPLITRSRRADWRGV